MTSNLIMIPSVRTQTITSFFSRFRGQKPRVIKIDDSIAINPDYVMYVESYNEGVKITMQDMSEFEFDIKLSQIVDMLRRANE